MGKRDAVAELAMADMHLQRVHALSESTLAAARALLIGPDSSTMRMSVLRLLEQLDAQALCAMNEVNCMAEAFNVNFEDKRWLETYSAVCSAVRGLEVKNG